MYLYNVVQKKDPKMRHLDMSWFTKDTCDLLHVFSGDCTRSVQKARGLAWLRY